MPFGGGSGGVNIDNKLYTFSEKKRMVERYIQELGNFKVISPGLDTISRDYGI